MRRAPLLISCSMPVLLAGCWMSHGSLRDAADGGDRCDPVSAPVCATRASPCAAPELVRPECVGSDWSCPAGALLYAAPWADDRCLPLFGRLDPLLSDGVHESPVPVPLGDRCAWVFPVELGGTHLVAADIGQSCDALGDPRPVHVAGDGFDYLAVSGWIDAGTEVRVLVRGWRYDALAPFGVRAVGVGLSRTRGDLLDVSAWLFGPDEDLGDAAIADGGFVYAYGSPGEPHWIEEDAIVARAPLASIDDRGAWSYFGASGWGADAPVRVFGTGPHRGPVVRDPRGGLLHVYAVGFGREILATRAPSPEGPWSAPEVLVACELPPDDPGAYCAGPYPHVELFDLLRPDLLVLSYSIGTTSPDGHERRRRAPEAYWPRVVRVRS